jgi:hypothetical protein
MTGETVETTGVVVVVAAETEVAVAVEIEVVVVETEAEEGDDKFVARSARGGYELLEIKFIAEELKAHS